MLVLDFPFTLQQSIYQTVTTVALGIFAIPYASFMGETKLLCDSLTLDIVPKQASSIL